jgi:hypothetical protein
MTSEQSIRDAIAAQVKIAAPLAVVWNHWVLGSEPTEWQAVMRSPDDANRVHGWCVTRRIVPVTAEMSEHISTKPTYILSGVHYFFHGSNADNSENLWQAEIDAVIQQFAKHDTAAAVIANHEELQVRMIGHQNSGAEKIHWTYGELTLEIC